MIKSYSLYLTWILACAAVLGSLFFSELMRLEPCHLCWYQRSTIYPLAFVMGIAAYRGDRSIVPYAIALVIVGLILSGYQIVIQEVPEWQPIELCGAGPNCTDKIDIGLGPITIPMLSFAALLIMLALLIIALV